MSIKYTFLSEKPGLKGTKLQVCSDENMSVSILQYKMQGQLLYSHERGMYSEDRSRQMQQIKEFIKIADERSMDFAVTPEASVPLEIIKEIIEGRIQRPEAEKLWCLGTEGIYKEEYKELIAEWSKKQDIVFIYPQKVVMSKHINPMFYIFQTAEHQLAVVLQAKTGAMKDDFFQHEQADLSRGEEIFIVDLNGDKAAQNVLVTLICADVLNVNIAQFCSNFHGKSPVILNIQMNPKPYHGKFIEFRENIFNDNALHMAQMIVANWGRGTTIDLEGERKTSRGYSDSGSTVYFSIGNNHWQMRRKRILENPDFIREGLGEAQKSGLEYFLADQYEVWKMQEQIEVAYYEKKIGYRVNSERDMTVRQYYPYIVQKYKYNEQNDLEEVNGLSCDCDEMNEVLTAFGQRASDDIQKCAHKSCRECSRFYAEALISLCLGEEILDEFSIENRKSHRTVQTLYQGSKDSQKKTKLKNLAKGLDEIMFPERFGEFNENDNFYFEVNRNAVERGGDDKYNLVLRCQKSRHKMLVVYLGNMEYQEVCRKYVKIKESVCEDRQDDILLYYVDAEGMHTFAEPYEKESILAHNNGYSADIESFK